MENTPKTANIFVSDIMLKCFSQKYIYFRVSSLICKVYVCVAYISASVCRCARLSGRLVQVSDASYHKWWETKENNSFKKELFLSFTITENKSLRTLKSRLSNYALYNGV